MSRMTKEELREDPVLEWIQGAIEWTQANSRWIAMGAALVVVVVIAGVMYTRAQRQAELESHELLSAGQSYYLQGNPAAAEAQLQQLIDEYSGSKAAKSGRIYLGDALLAQNRPQEALTVYEEAIGAANSPELRAAAQRGKAAALESMERFAEASAAYEAAASQATALQVDDLIGAARSALAAGQPDRAQAVLERTEDLDATGQQGTIAFYQAQAHAALR